MLPQRVVLFKQRKNCSQNFRSCDFRPP